MDPVGSESRCFSQGLSLSLTPLDVVLSSKRSSPFLSFHSLPGVRVDSNSFSSSPLGSQGFALETNPFDHARMADPSTTAADGGLPPPLPALPPSLAPPAAVLSPPVSADGTAPTLSAPVGVTLLAPPIGVSLQPPPALALAPPVTVPAPTDPNAAAAAPPAMPPLPSLLPPLAAAAPPSTSSGEPAPSAGSSTSSNGSAVSSSSSSGVTDMSIGTIDRFATLNRETRALAAVSAEPPTLLPPSATPLSPAAARPAPSPTAPAAAPAIPPRAAPVLPDRSAKPALLVTKSAAPQVPGAAATTASGAALPPPLVTQTSAAAPATTGVLSPTAATSPLPAATPATAEDKAAKQTRLRLKVLEEILDTERAYVASLQALSDYFVTPLSADSGPGAKLLTPKELTELFSNIADILNLNRCERSLFPPPLCAPACSPHLMCCVQCVFAEDFASQ